MRVRVRYTTPKGIGYRPGYTTAEAFFSPSCFLNDTWLPFVDLRAHVFDTGKPAVNAGFGWRYLAKRRIWGANAYYDYRNTKRQHYNQVAVGLESLGAVWDFRINGYLPVGKKYSPYFSPKFYAFEGNELLIQLKRDFALKGFDAAAAYHFNHFKDAPLYFSLGTYYLTGVATSTWGAELIASADLFTYLTLQGNLSYDHFFKWIGQAQIGINIPFGKKCTEKRRGPNSINALATQRIYRHEIIPVGKEKAVTAAINPLTLDPWIFWFVDNTSHSSGTYENPFALLVDAQMASAPNQAIYIFPGDGTSTGMNGGITLKEAQLLLGSSVDQQIPTTEGSITIPPMGATLPYLTNLSGDVVTLANNNTVSGLLIDIQQNGANGLIGNGIYNLFLDRSDFISSTAASSINGVSLTDSSGQITVEENSFNGFSSGGVGINISNGSIASFQSLGNIFSNFDSSSAIVLSGGNVNSLSASSNTFSDFSLSVAIGISGANVSSLNASTNTFSNFANTSSGIAIAGNVSSLYVSANTFSNFTNTANGIGIFTGIVEALVASSNTFSNFSILGNGIGISGGSVTSLSASKNTFSNFSSASVCIGISAGNVTTLSSTKNTFSNFENSSLGIGVSGGTLLNLNASYNTFSNFSLSGGIGISGGTISSLSFSKNRLSNFGNVSSGLGISGGSFLSLRASDNTFSNFSGSGISIDQLTNVSSTAAISGSLFSGGIGAIDGFAADIQVDNGSLCLEFIHNAATPVSSPTPYVFGASGPGTFNRTLGSDQTTNVGTFSLMMVGDPGSCSLP